MNYAVAKELEENPFGVTEVFTAPDAVVDVVLVHGLTGHPYNTWSTDDRKVFWPVDLLPTNVKKARILVYGYDADVASFKGGTSKDKIHNHAETLVQRLSANRSLEDATERPIIFICHSLGGLVVKRALSYSCNVTNANLEQQRSIYVSTYGVLFLGTPHNGSDLAKWGSLLQAIASVAPKKVLDSSPQLVDALKSQSETLQNINRYFVQIMYRFHILFCHEGKPTDLKGTRQFVVDEDSAAPPFADVERMVIETDHSHMCKFATKRSPGYEGVAEAIKRFAENAPGTIKRRWSEERDARRDALRAQAFDMIPKSVMDSIGGSPHTGTASTAGNSTTSLSWKDPTALTIAQPTEVVSIDPQISEPLLIAPPTFRPNSSFYGMEYELQELNRRLFNAKKRAIGPACVLLWCPPGGGKSHLARQYVFSHKKDFPGGIFWIDARLRGDRFQGFWEVAQGAAMKSVQDYRENKETAATFVETVKKWFEARQEWLLVFDGVSFDKDEDVTDFQKFIPDSKNCSIIYTSVDRTLVRKQRLLYPVAVKVRPLDEKDALNLLYKGLGIRQPTTEQDERARALVRHLECLPLAIHAMGHRLSATQKAIEKYHIESYSTDSKLAEPYIGIMADLRRFHHPEALNLIHILSFFGHNVPVAMLNLGRQVLKDANIYIKSSDRGSKRDVDTTFGTLIKYGLMDRALIRYDLIDRSTPDVSDRTQGSQDSLVSTLETIDILKIHSVVQGFCCDSLKEEGQFVYWLEIAIKVFCQSFDRADAQMNRQPPPGLVKDYREYETHGQRLLSHLTEKVAKTSSLRETRSQLQRSLGGIKHEIQNRSPGSSQQSFRHQASIFDRTTSTSDDAPDTPRSTPSMVSTLGLGLEKPQVVSPTSIDGHHGPLAINLEEPDPHHIPYYSEDAGYTADQEELGEAFPLTPTRSEDTARPLNSTSNDHGTEWQLVSNRRKLPRSKLTRAGQSGVGSTKRPRARKDLGSFHPTTAKTGVNTVPAVGFTSRPMAEFRGEISGSSDAVTSLSTIHHASPPPSRGGGNISPRRPLSRPPPSQAQVRLSDQAPLDKEAAERVKPEQQSSKDLSPNLSQASPVLENIQRGRSRETLRSRQGNTRPSPLAAEFVPKPRVTQSALDEVGLISPPPTGSSHHRTPNSSPGFTYMNLYHSSDPYISGMSPVFMYNENDGSRSLLPSPSGRNPAPLPFEGGVTITAKRRLPADFRGHHRTGSYQPYRSPSRQRYYPQPAYPQTQIYYPTPLPPGYSSQPMSRNASGQSNHYAETEPPLYQPSFSPHLGTITPTTPRDRLPDGCSLRKSPKFAHAFPIHREDIFEPIDPRYTTDQAITGMGTWADSTSPISPNQDLSMSRSSSGPGIAVEGANHGLGIAQFGGKLRFGQHEPFSVEEARQRTLEHERRLRAFDQGAFRPPQPLWGQGNWGGKNSGAGGGLGQPYPDINLIPTSSDEVVLQGYVDGRRRGLSAPGRPGIRGLGFEYDDEVYGQGV